MRAPLILLLGSLVSQTAGCGDNPAAATADLAVDNRDGGSGNDASGPTADLAGTPAAPVCPPPITLANTATPTTVIGDGNPGSCTEVALRAAISKGGVITFACGSPHVLFALSQTLELPTDRDTTIDGGGTVTLDGHDLVRILDWNHLDFRANSHVLTLQRITLQNGKATGSMMYPSHPLPCSSGYYDGAGGALYMRDGVLHVIDSVFTNNHAAELGPDVGGGALYLAGCRKAIITGSTFTGNSGSNAGAIGSLNSDLDVYNSTFENNVALGFGANSDDKNKCAFQDPVTKQYQVGSGGNGGAIAIDGGSDGAETFCGDVFRANKGGKGALGGAIFRTPDLARQTTTIDKSLFDANTADSAGACYFHNSQLTITASTFSNNVGQGIGTIQADGTTFDFTNVTFFGNHSAAGVGASLALFGGDGKLLNCTFAHNHCDAPNMFAAAVFGGPKLTVQNCLFVDNTGTNPSEPMQCKLDAASGGAGDLQWPTMKLAGGMDQACVTGIKFSDPMVGALGDHGGPVPTALVAQGSLAIGAGAACPPTDARGKARPMANCTAGATEGTN